MGSYSVVGLGKLGACMAAAIAAQGNEVVGVDVNHSVVDDLAAGRAPLGETLLQETIDRAAGRLTATLSFAEAVQRSDVTFVVVPTPSDERGAFSIDYARAAFEELGAALAEKDSYHLIVLSSTVLPGSCRYGLLPVLESASGKDAGQDFGFCYSPEFIALGSVIPDFLNPDFLLIGEYDERSGALLANCYQEIVQNGAEAKRMSIENAELAKVSLNSFVTMKITFANMLAQICEEIPEGDVDAITDAIGADRRVGRSYLKGGLGFGGPCFPRDNVALSFLAEQLGVDAALPKATDVVNRHIPQRVVERIGSVAPAAQRAVVVGVAYKPGTSVVEESQGLAIAAALVERRIDVALYDPMVPPTTLNGASLPRGARIVSSLCEAMEQADLAVLATPDRDLAAQVADHADDEMTVIDCWRILPPVDNVVFLGRAHGTAGELLSELVHPDVLTR